MSGRRWGFSIGCALAAGAALVPSAAAVVAERSVVVDRPVERACQDGLLPAGTPGVARARFAPPETGVVTIRLAGTAGDWDLAVFDARSRRLQNAGATYGPRERAIAAAAPGRELIAQACRRTGPGRPARVSFDLHPQPPVDPGEPAALVEVPLDGTRGLERLEATGLDVTHDTGPTHAKVVVYSAAERARLLAAGFTFRTLIADMRSEDLKRARADRAYARLVAASPLPSGREGYRTLADYGTDLKAIADGFPSIARRVEIGRSLEDRPIEGVELAADVGRRDDGRPVYVVMGLHHAREWPSGEMPMEFALDLARSYANDARVRSLLDRVRVVVLPVINPDGFNVSRTAGPTPFDDSPEATLPLIVSDGASYKRKNCRAAAPESQGTPCMTRPAGQGVDLNRNYGAYWGGVGSSSNPVVQNYRGTAPYSEPEAEAVHRLSSTRPIVTLITHHTFTDQGEWLRQPGFCFTQPCNADDVVPDEAGMKALGDAMGAATGWNSNLGWEIGEITGATEDWNYFTQGAYGYTPEQRGPNFHPNFQDSVVEEYTGAAPGAAGGVREALMRAGEQAANPSFHSLLLGTAAPGHVLRLRKSFLTDTSMPNLKVNDRLEFTLRVPDSGTYAWHVNQSTRPLSTATESYTLTCEAPGGGVRETRDVAIARGQTVTVDLACGGPPVAPGPPPGPPTGPLCADVRAPLSRTSRRSLRLSRRHVRLTGRASDRGCRGTGAEGSRRGRVVRVFAAVARRERGGRCRFLTPARRLGPRRRCARARYLPARGTARWSFRMRTRLPSGSYLAWSRALDASGNFERRRRIVRFTVP
jgi:hypothetical protein